jgi:hypothetical protein
LGVLQTQVTKVTMAQKPIHHGNSPASSDNSNNESRTPSVGVFSVPSNPSTGILYQESAETKMRLLANLMIDKIFFDKNNGTLKKEFGEK